MGRRPSLPLFAPPGRAYHPPRPPFLGASQCRNMHWENLDKLLAIVDREFGEQGFYHAGPGGETLSLQDGVVRTNCMDCLDRTNVVQSLLARRSMLVSLPRLPCTRGYGEVEVWLAVHYCRRSNQRSHTHKATWGDE